MTVESRVTRTQRLRSSVQGPMLGLWQQDIEWLEAISQDADARALFLRMAALSQEGRLEPFLVELNRDEELDDQTKGTVAELAQDEAFLMAVADYLRNTHHLH